jgi:hypothetical protein
MKKIFLGIFLTFNCAVSATNPPQVNQIHSPFMESWVGSTLVGISVVSMFGMITYLVYDLARNEKMLAEAKKRVYDLLAKKIKRQIAGTINFEDLVNDDESGSKK